LQCPALRIVDNEAPLNRKMSNGGGLRFGKIPRKGHQEVASAERDLTWTGDFSPDLGGKVDDGRVGTGSVVSM